MEDEQPARIQQLGPDERVCYTYDLPVAPRALVVLAHGLSGDRVGPAWVLSRLAAAVAHAGYAVLRCDAPGSGDSAGQFGTSTLSEAAQALAAGARSTAVAELPVVCLGLSTGGVVAVETTQLLGDRVLGTLCLSSDLLEMTESPQVPITLRNGEFHLFARFAADRARLRPRSDLVESGRRFAFALGERDAEIVDAVGDLRALSPERLDVVPDAGHVFGSPATQQLLKELVLDALERWLP